MYLFKKNTYRTLLKLFFLLTILGHATAADFRGDVYRLENDNGYFQLEWSADSISSVILQQSTTPEFEKTKDIYEGIDRATFISGLANGDYYYRVKEINADQWSPTFHVTVAHQSLTLAYSLFTVGAIVFLLTVGLVFKGTKDVAKSK